MAKSNKVAIVTGSATGLGAACAVDLAGRGWNVVINYTKSKKEADATRLMAVMGMGVTQGMEVTVELSGEDEEQDYATLKEFFEKNL